MGKVNKIQKESSSSLNQIIDLPLSIYDVRDDSLLVYFSFFHLLIPS